MQLNGEIGLLLEPYTPRIQQVATAARELILELMPDLIEQVDFPAHLIAYGLDRTYRGMVCGIALYPFHVNLMVAPGAILPDPNGLLQGTGKRARHVKLTTLADLEQQGLRTLLQQALMTVQATYSLPSKK